MKVVLKPLFDTELPAEFGEIVREKLKGRELRTGETVEVELLGKPLPFKVLLAEPSPIKVRDGVRVELSRGEVDEVTLSIGSVEDAVPFEGGLAVVVGEELVLLDWRFRELYRRTFPGLKKVRAANGKVVVVHGEKITILEP